MGRILAITHPGGGTSGVFADAALEHGDTIDEWSPALEPDAARALDDYRSLVVLGGDQNVCELERYPYLSVEIELIGEWLASGRPLLGVCLGAQLLAHVAGGDVVAAHEPELGWYDVELTAEGRADPVLGFGAARFSSLQWHSYAAQPPACAAVLARNDACVQAFRIGSAWGVQYHPEVTTAIIDGWIADARTSGEGDPVPAFGDLSARLSPWMAYGRELFARFAALPA